MLIDFFNRHVMQPLWARKAGSQHLRYLDLLRKTQFDSPEIVRQRQLRMLKAMLQHAYETVPYYQRVWWDAGVHPSQVERLEDLEQFPVVTKDDLRKHESEFLSTKFDRAKLLLKRTSGSTGVPLNIYINEQAKQWKYACTLRSDEWSGWKLGQRVAKVWGNPEYRQFGLKGRLRNHFLDRATYLDTVSLTEERLSEFAESIRQHPPGLIFGHAHSLYLLAEWLKKKGISGIRPNGILSTAMPLHSWQRKVIEEVFGVPVTDRYGCEEVSLIACECEQHRGLHVNTDSVYTEIREPKNDLPINRHGEDSSHTGHLLVTDLVNFAMPLIRYQVGDMVTLSDRECGCGRRGMPLLEKVEGRDADYVQTPAGSLISGISLTENFALKIDHVAQIQIVQERLDFLRLRIVPGEGFGEPSHRQIDSLVAEMFGGQMRHEVELVDRIPQEKSGKYRFCISRVTHPDPAEAGNANRLPDEVLA